MRAMIKWSGGGIPYGYQYDYASKKLIQHPQEKNTKNHLATCCKGRKTNEYL